MRAAESPEWQRSSQGRDPCGGGAGRGREAGAPAGAAQGFLAASIRLRGCGPLAHPARRGHRGFPFSGPCSHVSSVLHTELERGLGCLAASDPRGGKGPGTRTRSDLPEVRGLEDTRPGAGAAPSGSSWNLLPGHPSASLSRCAWGHFGDVLIPPAHVPHPDRLSD